MKALNLLLIIAIISITSPAFAIDNISQKQRQEQIIESAIYQLDRNLSAEEFDAFIAKKYNATHLFLSKLPKKQQKQVYEYYQQHADFNMIRHKIFELFFKEVLIKSGGISR